MRETKTDAMNPSISGASERPRKVTMGTQFVGSHYVLSGLPIWASALLFFGVTMGVIYVARDVFEGLPYQVAYSAQFGDTALARSSPNK